MLNRHFTSAHRIALSLLLVILVTACSDPEKLQPLASDATILAFGDSITYGTGTSRDKAYPAVLQTLINRNIINAGVPGEISRQGLARLRLLLDRHRPDLIILCHGGNDILRRLDLEQTRDNIQQMIDLARQNNSQVVLIGVPEFSLLLSASPIYRELADKNHIPLANDILAEILGDNSLKSDHIHPNSQGYRLLAEKIASLLRRAGGLTGN